MNTPGFLKAFACVATAVATFLVGSPLLAVSHSYVNTYRSSANTHIYVSQEIDGEYGKFVERTSEAKASGKSTSWRGYGMRTSLGLEVMKFIQFAAGHSFVNLRSNQDSLENIDGSRLFAESKLVFSSPVGNLEAGGGVTALRLDYQKQLASANLVGNGVYYSLGMNYFLSSRVSLQARGTFLTERMIPNGGSDEVSGFDTETSAFGAGFRVWL